MHWQQRISTIMAISAGNLIEWFDFYVYSFCAIYFAPAFFPSSDPTTQLLNTAGIFAAGFLMRPLGAWFFGRLADRQGRRLATIVAVLMISSGSLVIACLPTYAQIGALAPLLLLFARLLQGFAVGGGYGVSATYLSEIAFERHRGLFASFQPMTLIGGQLLALFSIMLLQHLLTVAQLQSWGWRVLFLLGAASAFIVLWLRNSLKETTTEAVRHRQDAGTLRGLLQHKRACFLVFCLTASGSLTFYTFTTYMQKYLVNTAGMAPHTVSVLMLVAISLCLPLYPLYGALSDRIGRKNMMILFSALTAACTIPIMSALKTAAPYSAFIIVLFALMVVIFYTSIGGILKAEMFPTELRALGVSLPFAIANALFGGTAEYLALWMKSAGIESYFYWYVTGVALISLVISLTMPDSRRHGYLQHQYRPTL